MIMKTKVMTRSLGILTMTLLMTTGFTACSDLTSSDMATPTSYTIATVKVVDPDEEFYFLSDKGNKIYPSNLRNLNYEAVDGQRVIAYFDEVTEAAEAYDYVAKVVYIENILTKDIIPISEATQDSIGDDPAEFLSYWLTEDYLTIEFVIWGDQHSGVSHLINLVEDPTKNNAEDTYLNLEFRHNMNGDHPRQQLQGLVSFRVPKDTGKIGMKIRVNTSLDRTKYYTIDFDEVAASSRALQAPEVNVN
jgi:hypothetical protein